MKYPLETEFWVLVHYMSHTVCVLNLYDIVLLKIIFLTYMVHIIK